MTTSKEICEIIQKGLNDKLTEVLNETPELINGKTEQGISFLQFAVYCKNKFAVDLFKQKKPHLDLYEAASIGDLDTVKSHIDNKPGLVNSYAPDGFTPLGLSCFFGHITVAKYLIEKGANTSQSSNNPLKVAPIRSACTISNYEIAELLVLNGADVNVREQADYAPLHIAAISGQTKLAKLLIENGAEINSKMLNGKTPFLLAQEKSFSETAEVIHKHGGK